MSSETHLLTQEDLDKVYDCYMVGFNEELEDTTPKKKYLKSLEKAAYEIGRMDALYGDEVASLNYRSKEQIVQDIIKKHNTTNIVGILLVVDEGDASVGVFPSYFSVQCPFLENADAEEKEFFRQGILKVYKEFSEGKLRGEFI